MFLTEDELRQLTGKKQWPAQARALRAMGIQHKTRPDGHVLVLRSHVEALLGGAHEAKVAVPEPDWSAIDAS